MANPFYSAMGGMNIMGMLSQFKSNPFGMLSKAGFNVPSNLNSPNDIIQHLMNSGQLTQAQYNQAQNIAQQFNMN